ncbi:ABC transporter permease [Hartmannibacter diazotrophicus]|nr:ABC transporter permease [Hartmannibacter diazotrophicus]
MAFVRYRQALVALILRDIKTRFFGSAWGYLLAVAWPLTHIAALMTIHTLAGRLPPYGDSGALWFATGIVPFMAFAYMSRMIMFGPVLNRPLLIFPTVKIMDILLARAIVETLSAGIVVIILAIYFTAAGVDFMPYDVPQAFFALGTAMLLGLGFGVINSVIAQAVPMWVTGYSLSIIIYWIASGVFFIPDNLPELARYILSFNPILQAVTWMRSAYYEGYGSLTLDKSYAVGVGVATLFFGLMLERFARGRLLQG